MVWSFVAGTLIGFPIGCYLRENGYTKKMRKAYYALQPDSNYLATDNLEKLLPS